MSQTASASLLDQIQVTAEEREFGWSASLSGVRGLSERQARRILHFENSLRQHLEVARPGNTLQHQRNTTSSNEFGKKSCAKEPLEIVAARHCRATCTRNPFSPCILKPRASLPEYQRLASSKLNRSLRLSSSQSSFLRFRSLKKSKSEESWSSESDELTYLIAREKKGNSDAAARDQAGMVNPELEKSHPKTGLRGLVRKLVGGTLLSPTADRPPRTTNQHSNFIEEPSHLYHLSHDMVGAASPFPMRPPLYLGSGHPSSSLNGEWIGISRNMVSESNRKQPYH